MDVFIPVILGAILISAAIRSFFAVDLDSLFYGLFITLIAAVLARTIQNAKNGVGMVEGSPLFRRKDHPIVFWITTSFWIISLSGSLIFLSISFIRSHATG